MEAAKEASELQVSSKGPEVKSLTRVSPKPYFCCGKKGHAPENCYFRMQKCKKCDKLGHTYQVCRSPPADSTEKPQPSGEKPSKDAQPRKHQSHFVELEDQALGLFTVKSNANSSFYPSVWVVQRKNWGYN